MKDTNETTIEDLFNAMGQVEKVREILREAFLHRADDPDDPHDFEFYEDFIEVTTELFRNKYPFNFMIEIEGEEFFPESSYELTFLAWIRQLMKRGLDFEQAFSKARGIIGEMPDLEYIVYELEDEDQYLVDAWIERLTEHGVEDEKARHMAEDIVKVLQQQYYANEEAVFEEGEREPSRGILDKLNALRASAASA